MSAGWVRRPNPFNNYIYNEVHVFTRQHDNSPIPLPNSSSCLLFGSFIISLKTVSFLFEIITLAEWFGEGIAFGSVCLFVCLTVCLSVCLTAQNFRIFLRNCLSDWDDFFHHWCEYSCRMFQWQLWRHRLCGVAAINWKNGENLDLCISVTTPRKILKHGTH